MSIKNPPEGYHSLIPYIICEDAEKAIAFYKTVFGATQKGDILPSANGKIGHCELRIGDSVLMIADPMPEMGIKAPAKDATGYSFVVYLPDVDSVIQKALDYGSTIVMPTEDKFYGDRMGTVRDPFGHIWNIATHTRDVSPEEIKTALAKMNRA